MLQQTDNKNMTEDFYTEMYLNNLLTQDIKKALPESEIYLNLCIIDVFKDLGIWDQILSDFLKPIEIVKQCQLDEKRIHAIDWMCRRLASENWMDMRMDNESELFRIQNIGKTNNSDSNQVDKTALKNNLIKISDRMESVLKAMDIATENYHKYLKGSVVGPEVFFNPQNASVIFDYFSISLFYKMINEVGGWVSVEECKNYNQKANILEVGGGIGGGTLSFFDMCRKNNIHWNTYVYTDISLSMLKKAKRSLKQSFQDFVNNMQFEKMDFNMPVQDQGFLENHFDLILGFNAAHVSYDLQFTLNEFKKLLKPGGKIILAEAIRSPKMNYIQHEFVLNFFDDYWHGIKHPDYRSSHGFLYTHEWVKALDHCGFKNSRSAFNMEAVWKGWDRSYTTAIIGEK